MYAPQQVEVAGVVDRLKEGPAPALAGRDAVDVIEHVVSSAQ